MPVRDARHARVYNWKQTTPSTRRMQPQRETVWCAFIDKGEWNVRGTLASISVNFCYTDIHCVARKSMEGTAFSANQQHIYIRHNDMYKQYWWRSTLGVVGSTDGFLLNRFFFRGQFHPSSCKDEFIMKEVQKNGTVPLWVWCSAVVASSCFR